VYKISSWWNYSLCWHAISVSGEAILEVGGDCFSNRRRFLLVYKTTWYVQIVAIFCFDVKNIYDKKRKSKNLYSDFRTVL
jgi:hypothetical protein